MDPIADMLATIKNAQDVFKKQIEIPASKVRLEVIRVLKQERFINEYSLDKPENKIVVVLKYHGKYGAITAIERISKPGRRMYTKASRIPTILRGLGIVILSTPKGIMSGFEAKKKSLGGELICKVW